MLRRGWKRALAAKAVSTSMITGCARETCAPGGKWLGWEWFNLLAQAGIGQTSEMEVAKTAALRRGWHEALPRDAGPIRWWDHRVVRPLEESIFRGLKRLCLPEPCFLRLEEFKTRSVSFEV